MFKVENWKPSRLFVLQVAAVSHCVFVCMQAVYASVLPGELMRGYMSQFPTFPSWLGKNSSTNKHSRIVQDLASHMSLKWVWTFVSSTMSTLTNTLMFVCLLQDVEQQAGSKPGLPALPAPGTTESTPEARSGGSWTSRAAAGQLPAHQGGRGQHHGDQHLGWTDWPLL